MNKFLQVEFSPQEGDNKESKNSHIQLNAAMMERFSFMAVDPESGKFQSKVPTVYYLDINAKEIKTEKVKKLGTELGYFSNKDEQLLGTVEHEFAQIAHDFDKWEQGRRYDLESQEAKIKEFANLLISRSELRRKQMQYLFHKVFTENYKGDMELLKKHPIKITPPPMFTDKHGVTLMINDTAKNLVVSRNGWCFCSPVGTEKCFVLPISHKRAIILYPKGVNFFRGVKLGNSPIAIVHVSDDVSISAFNNSALLTEKAVDNSFVLSKTREELEELLDFIKSDKWQLFDARA